MTIEIVLILAVFAAVCTLNHNIRKIQNTMAQQSDLDNSVAAVKAAVDAAAARVIAKLANPISDQSIADLGVAKDAADQIAP